MNLRRYLITLLPALFLGLSASVAGAQPKTPDPVGIWTGALDVGTIKLRLVFEVKAKDASYSATMKSLDQGGQTLPCSKVTFGGGKLRIEVASIGGAFEGQWSKDGQTLTGNWTQGPTTLPLILTRTDKAPVLRRPQEPKPPFPYVSEDVSYPSRQSGVTIAGTLTLPPGAGPFPVVLLITGSGAQNRDEEILGHKPFLVLADYLTRRGIAVLRSDDRGIGRSTGNFATATSVDFAEDVRGGIAFLKSRKEIDPAKIGLIGHSEGALIAPMIAADAKEIAFLVLMAGPGVPGEEILLDQAARIATTAGVSETVLASNRRINSAIYSLVKAGSDTATLRTKLAVLLDEEFGKLPEAERQAAAGRKEAILQSVDALTSPWFRFFLSYDPRPSLRKVTCPTLAINGQKDLQVSAARNLPEIEKAFRESGNTRLTTRELPGLNHLFQPTKTGSLSEYGTIEETISPVALQTIGDWVLSVTR
ncbi:MAG: alpha/beta fold hydrolase [Capsulimonadales bacterium]|nr:alpha/beta fold hydrolase [Capsulimonadales bacterium]